jgi:Ulp1 family protease
MKVPQQLNGKDCACFLIYFARRFLLSPEGTMALIKVCGFVFLASMDID